jgi:adenosylhomocysteine nucleosidase
MIAIAFALEFESACFRARHDPRLRVGVWLLGAMGAGAAKSLERKLDASVPALLISAGFAGGLQPGLKAGDLVLGENYSDPDVVSKLSLNERWHVGGVSTAQAILERSEDKRRLGVETGCLAGDLETAQLARICAERALPMLSVRCISDTLEDDLPVPASTLLNPRTGRPDPLTLFRHMINHPSCVSGFNKLLKNSRLAQAQLAKGLEEILPQLLRMV